MTQHELCIYIYNRIMVLTEFCSALRIVDEDNEFQEYRNTILSGLDNYFAAARSIQTKVQY